MLTAFRNMLRSKFAGLLFALIIVSMAVWGITDIFRPRTDATFISAGGLQVSNLDFDQAVERELFLLRSNDGVVISKAEAAENGTIDFVLAQEAARTARSGYIRQLGGGGSDALVLDAMRNEEAFRGANGQFSPQQYREVLRRNEQTPAGYARAVRDDQALNYLRTAALSALEPPDTLGRLEAAYLNEARRAQWIEADIDDVEQTAPPEPSDLRAFYEDNRDRYRIPERRVIEVLQLSPATFTRMVEVSDEEIEARYGTPEEARYRTAERRVITELVFRTEAEARRGLAALGAGTPSAEIPGALTRRTNELARADLPEGDEFANDLFGAPERAVLGPREIAGNFRVFRVDEVIEGDARPLDDTLRGEIRNALAREKATLQYQESAYILDELIGGGLNVEQMAAELGVPYEITPPVTDAGRTAEGEPVAAVADYDEALAQAFSLGTGFVGDRFDTESGSVVMGATEIIEPVVPPFEQIEPRVLSDYLVEQRAERAERLGRTLKAEAESGTPLSDIAARLGVELEQTDGFITREAFAGQLPLPAALAMFEASEGDVLFVPTSPGSFILLEVTGERALDGEDMTLLAARSAAAMTQGLSEDVLYAMEVGAREAAGLDINAGAYEAYKAGLGQP